VTGRDASRGGAADKAAKGGYHDDSQHTLSMSASGLQGLLKAAFDDPDLEARLKEPGADVVTIAEAAGFKITAEEFSQALQAWDNWRMSSIHDEED
jgi:predicted ribosomally synthesized peptide with nif11-like leader